MPAASTAITVTAHAADQRSGSRSFHTVYDIKGELKNRPDVCESRLTRIVRFSRTVGSIVIY